MWLIRYDMTCLWISLFEKTSVFCLYLHFFLSFAFFLLILSQAFPKNSVNLFEFDIWIVHSWKCSTWKKKKFLNVVVCELCTQYIIGFEKEKKTGNKFSFLSPFSQTKKTERQAMRHKKRRIFVLLYAVFITKNLDRGNCEHQYFHLLQGRYFYPDSN